MPEANSSEAKLAWLHLFVCQLSSGNAQKPLFLGQKHLGCRFELQCCFHLMLPNLTCRSAVRIFFLQSQTLYNRIHLLRWMSIPVSALLNHTPLHIWQHPSSKVDKTCGQYSVRVLKLIAMCKILRMLKVSVALTMNLCKLDSKKTTRGWVALYISMDFLKSDELQSLSHFRLLPFCRKLVRICRHEFWMCNCDWDKKTKVSQSMVDHRHHQSIKSLDW